MTKVYSIIAISSIVLVAATAMMSPTINDWHTTSAATKLLDVTVDGAPWLGGLPPASTAFSGDDTAAIQATIQYAESNGGGIVFLPEGYYEISSPLAINVGGVEIQGQGIRSIVAAPLTASVPMQGAMFDINSATGPVRINKLRLDRSASSFSVNAGDTGIRANFPTSPAPQLIFHDLLIRGHNTAIEFIGLVAGAEVRDVKGVWNNNGFRATTSNTGHPAQHMAGNYFSNVRMAGAIGYHSTSSAPGQIGWKFEGPVLGDQFLSDCWSEAFTTGIRIDTSSATGSNYRRNFELHNCVMDRNASRDIHATNVDRLRITGGTITGATSEFDSCSAVTITGATLAGHADTLGSPIRIGALINNCSGFSITGCEFNTLDTGIAIIDSNRVSISGCAFGWNDTVTPGHGPAMNAGIKLDDSSFCSVTGNTFGAMTTLSVQINGTTTPTTAVLNIVSANTLFGFHDTTPSLITIREIGTADRNKIALNCRFPGSSPPSIVGANSLLID